MIYLENLINKLTIPTIDISQTNYSVNNKYKVHWNKTLNKPL